MILFLCDINFSLYLKKKIRMSMTIVFFYFQGQIQRQLNWLESDLIKVKSNLKKENVIFIVEETPIKTVFCFVTHLLFICLVLSSRPSLYTPSFLSLYFPMSFLFVSLFVLSLYLCILCGWNLLMFVISYEKANQNRDKTPWIVSLAHKVRALDFCLLHPRFFVSDKAVFSRLL